MAKAILSSSIAILICAAGLGLATRSRVEQRVRELAATRVDLKATKGALTAKSHDLEKTQDALALSQKDVDAKVTELSTRDAEAKTALMEVAKLDEAVKSRDEAVAKLQSDLAAATEKGAAALEKANLQLAETRKQADDAKAKSELDQTRLRAAEVRLFSLRRDEGGLKSAKPVNPAGLTGSVLAVNQPLNFVVLSLGDEQGVTARTPLLVMRGHQRIATLKISSVEPRGSIADVVPGSVARGQSVQAGDSVVFPGARGQQEAPESTKAPATAPAESGVPASGSVAPAAESRPTA